MKLKTQNKENKTKSVLFEKINKIDKPLAILTKKKANTNYQYEELNNNHHYKPQSHNMDNKKILQIRPYTYI